MATSDSAPIGAVHPGRSQLGVRIVAGSIGAIGLMLSVLGFFLPWVVSGGVERNSYAIVGIVRRLGVLGDGFGDTALSWWSMLAPLVVLPVIAGILRWWRCAAVLTIVFGLMVGVIGGGVLAVASGHRTAGIGLDHTGPVVTVIGAVLAVAGATTLLLAERRRRSRPSEVSTEPLFGSSRPTQQHNVFEAQ